MKQTPKVLGAVAVAVGLSFLVPATTQAGPGYRGGSMGGATGGFRGGSSGNSGGYHGGGYYGGYHGGYYGGHRGGYYGGWYPWNFSFSYVYAPSPYYYYDGYYYYPPTVYYPPPVVYSSQPAEVYNSSPPAPVTESSQQPDVNRPLSPTAVDRDSNPPSPRAQRPPQIQRSDQGQLLGVADVKALAKAGVGDEVILSQIRNSHAVYHLTTAEIIEFKESGVSEKIIDFMINTATP